MCAEISLRFICVCEREQAGVKPWLRISMTGLGVDKVHRQLATPAQAGGVGFFQLREVGGGGFPQSAVDDPASVDPPDGLDRFFLARGGVGVAGIDTHGKFFNSASCPFEQDLIAEHHEIDAAVEGLIEERSVAGF